MRNTTQKNAIEEVFRQHDRPLSVEEVLTYGREIVESLNQATVYRNLRKLIDEGCLKKIAHPSLGTIYERMDKEHHHHFHCWECNRAFELPGCALKKDKIAPAGFIVEEHEVFLSGICSSCAETRS
jgi:Fur family transcriptional regulator, ferric uptake regulator